MPPMIIIKKSTKAAHLLHNGKLVLLHPSEWQAHKAPVLTVDDTTFANLVTAYGSVVGS